MMKSLSDDKLLPTHLKTNLSHSCPTQVFRTSKISKDTHDLILTYSLSSLEFFFYLSNKFWLE